MSFDDQTYSRIASYLNNEMNEAEKAAFEVQLENDAELASFVDTFSTLEGVYNEDKWTVKSNATIAEVKALANAFRADDVADVSKKIRAIQQHTTNQETTSRSRKSYFYYISSAVAIAAVCTLFYFSFMQSITADDAFEQYHDWASLPSFQTKSDTNNNLAKASTLFQEEKYQEALSIFTTYAQESATYNPQIQLYIGVSHMELENYQEALQTFNQLQNSNTVDDHKAYWYTALTYLKQNDAENAKKVLKTLVENPSNYNYEKAKELLKKLK
ncbi:tetratricopeptide repeat protein [Kordia sp. YSTF-M3]|uniref:Tetratricopeptide repeat protein n=1 Tax=Kordia aestuariivivens TaxID=2759037 RepID=A0ABR7QG99_9FLAO|nr:tetratricopeptide repeat protein [Kordia aestuariivivens]MBC8757597.1 tetratricopeptide repeat protein [Kordia aestuariivivens]